VHIHEALRERLARAELLQLSFKGLSWDRLEAKPLSQHVRHDRRHFVEGQILRPKRDSRHRPDAHLDPLRRCGIGPIRFRINVHKTRNGTAKVWALPSRKVVMRGTPASEASSFRYRRMLATRGACFGPFAAQAEPARGNQKAPMGGLGRIRRINCTLPPPPLRRLNEHRAHNAHTPPAALKHFHFWCNGGNRALPHAAPFEPTRSEVSNIEQSSRRGQGDTASHSPPVFCGPLKLSRRQPGASRLLALCCSRKRYPKEGICGLPIQLHAFSSSTINTLSHPLSPRYFRRAGPFTFLPA
jgi:hypothetical protein